MADRIKPHVIEKVKLIREWENKMQLKEAKKLNFIKYHNYYAPSRLINESKTVLSFGVGGECKFEKLMLHENDNIKIELFDPTPYTVKHIESIMHRSGRKLINDVNRNRNLTKKINFSPFAYSHINGRQEFYYDPKREEEFKDYIHHLAQSFSLLKQKNYFKSVTVKTKNIQTILKELGWNSVDIIKADIEGLWEEFGNELLDNKIDFKYLATEFELNFDKNINIALDRATKLCNKFRDNNYTVILNRKRDKVMLELLFIRKDVYAG